MFLVRPHNGQPKTGLEGPQPPCGGTTGPDPRLKQQACLEGPEGGLTGETAGPLSVSEQTTVGKKTA